jgi:hypothetical protein
LFRLGLYKHYIPEISQFMINTLSLIETFLSTPNLALTPGKIGPRQEDDDDDDGVDDDDDDDDDSCVFYVYLYGVDLNTLMNLMRCTYCIIPVISSMYVMYGCMI